MYVRNKEFKKSIFTPWTWEEHVNLLLILGVPWPLLEAEVLAGDGPGVDDQAVVHGEADLGTGGNILQRKLLRFVFRREKIPTCLGEGRCQPQPHQEARLQSRGEHGEAGGDGGQDQAVPHHPLPEIVGMATILPEANVTHTTAGPSLLTLP